MGCRVENVVHLPVGNVSFTFMTLNIIYPHEVHILVFVSMLYCELCDLYGCDIRILSMTMGPGSA